MRDRNKSKQNLILTGLMGCGKTTVGRIVADQLRWEIIDTDRLIEEKTGCSIPMLFQEKGEPFFRRVESQVIYGLKGKERMVVATGGGVVLNGENRRLLRKIGLVFYLKTSPEVLGARVGRGGGRPLLNEKNPVIALAEILKEREKFYREADVVITTDGLTPAQVGAVIIRLARRRGIGADPLDS